MSFVLLETVQDGEERYLDWLVSGLGWTLALAITGWCIAFVIGVLVGSARTSQHRWLRIAGRLYVEVFRNVPVVLWIIVASVFLTETQPQPRDPDALVERSTAGRAGLGRRVLVDSEGVDF